MGSLAWLSLIAAAASGQRTLILTNKALEAVEAAKDLARQRRHALLEPHHVATTLFSDPNTFVLTQRPFPTVSELQVASTAS